jgi:hypothetical protein
LRNAYSEEALQAVKSVINAMKRGDGKSWDELEDLLGVGKGSLQRFTSELKDDVPKIDGMRKILDGVAAYVSKQSEDSNLRSICASDLDVVLGKTPHPLEFVKSKLLAEEPQQNRLSADMAGGYLMLRPSKRGALLAGHLHVIDTYELQGLTSGHIRRRLSQGGELSIKSVLYKKDSRINLVGVENVNRCFRTVAFRQIGDNFNRLTGIMSGYEIDGYGFACKVVVGRLKRDHFQFSILKEKTGVYEEDDLPKLEQLVSEVCTRPDDLLQSISEIKGSYISDDWGD